MKAEKDLDPYFYITGWIFLAVIFIYFILHHFAGFSIFHYLPPCALHLTTGFYCPGCGGSRAVLMLLAGHPLMSFYYHPLILYSLVVGGLFQITQSLDYLMRRWNRHFPLVVHVRMIYLWIALFLLLGNFVIKNGFLIVKGIALMG